MYSFIELPESTLNAVIDIMNYNDLDCSLVCNNGLKKPYKVLFDKNNKPVHPAKFDKNFTHDMVKEYNKEYNKWRKKQKKVYF